MRRARHAPPAVALILLATACGGDDAAAPAAGEGQDEAPQTGGDLLDEFGDVVYLNTSGGAVDEIWAESWWAPYTEATGVEVQNSSPADLSRLRAQVESGNVEWDMAEVETGGQYLEAIDHDLLTELDHDRLRAYFEAFGGRWNDIIPEALGTHGLGHAPFATILMFDKREFPDAGPQPTTLADLWNVEEFPGPRCIHEQAIYNLEIALRADGVDPADMYPLDIDRALGKLDELVPHVATFWRAGAEPIQFVADGECVLSTVWNGRPFGAQTEEGIDYFGVAWEGGTLSTGYWVIPRGAANVEAAYALMAYYQLPEVGAATANRIGYGNTNRAFGDLLTDEARAYVSTYEPNLEGLTFQDERWWFENGPEAEERFSEWRLTH